MKKIMYIAAALLVLVGCQKSQEAKENAPANYGTITGKIELPQGPNKIAAPEGWEEAETAFTMVWESTDKIYIYNQFECKELSVKSIDEQTGIATFEGELLPNMSEYKVAYGYDPQATATDFSVEYIAGNYHPFAAGEGTDYTFTIAKFEPVIGLQLKGTDALSKIEVVLSDKDNKTLATYTMTFAEALQLNESTASNVYFPIRSHREAAEMAISFYKKESSADVLIMTKTTANVPAAGKVTTFPELTVKDPYNGHAYVDLGLSVKWATCNLGATTPEGYGDYFAWGETEPYYSSLSPLTWKDDKEKGYDWPSYCGVDEFTEWNPAPYDATTKNLKPEYDAAHINWGGSWRMPTYAELDELKTKCTWTWTTLNSISGYEVKGPNKNTIFLPAAGYYNNSSLNSVGFNGNYWSSSLDSIFSSYACCLDFGSSYKAWSGYSRCYGLSVRPVCQ